MSISFSKWNDKTEMGPLVLNRAGENLKKYSNLRGVNSRTMLKQVVRSVIRRLCSREGMCNLVRLRRSTYERFLKPGRHLVKDR